MCVAKRPWCRRRDGYIHPTHTHNAVYILQSCSRWRPDHNSQLSFTNIAQPYIPISTAAPRTLRNTHTFLYFFQTSNFQNFFGPFPGALGAFAHHFRIPLLPLHTLKFFRRFDLYFRFLLHGTSLHILLGLVNICFRSKVQDWLYRGYYYY